MDRGMVVFLGALLTFTSSWLGLVLYPYWQLQNEPPYQKDATDDPYPIPLQGQALAVLDDGGVEVGIAGHDAEAVLDRVARHAAAQAVQLLQLEHRMLRQAVPSLR